MATAMPALSDVLAASRRIRPLLPPTPLLPSRGLSELLGVEVFVKCENLQPVGAFKVRGGVNLLAAEAPALRARATGVVAASTGNHGQSIAYAAARFGLPATIFAPTDSNPLKVAAMRALGAVVRRRGRDFDEARQACEAHAAASGARYVHSMNEPMFIAGVGTAAWEVLQEIPEANWLFVPVGGGSGAAGACLVASALAPRCRVVGVQAEGAPAVWRSFHARRLLSTERAATMAEGLSTRVAFALPLEILWRHLHGLVLVSDEALQEAMVLHLEHTHLVAEAAGAVPLAGALRLRGRLRGGRVVLMLSGGNATRAQLAAALTGAAGARSPGGGEPPGDGP